MTEGSDDAAILIAVSYQALHRALSEKEDKLFTNCTVMILFAGYYVEASLNYILDATGVKIKAFPLDADNKNGKTNPGLRDKLLFFYNEFMAYPKAKNWDELGESVRNWKLEETFPGFRALRGFRNDVSHGVINMSAMDLDYAKRIRQQAKDIVNQLYRITSEKGYKIARLTTYKKAIAAISQH